MKKIIGLVLILALSGCASSETWLQEETSSGGYKSSNSYKKDAYGPGVHMDQYGRPFEWTPKDGQKVEPWNNVKPNAYGPGVGMDQYGRPVYQRRR